MELPGAAWVLLGAGIEVTCRACSLLAALRVSPPARALRARWAAASVPLAAPLRLLPPAFGGRSAVTFCGCSALPFLTLLYVVEHVFCLVYLTKSPYLCMQKGEGGTLIRHS